MIEALESLGTEGTPIEHEPAGTVSRLQLPAAYLPLEERCRASVAVAPAPSPW